jgi:two-component system chemotaxis response regulator CheB
MPKRDIIAMGGSAESLEAIKEIVRSFTPDFPASVFVMIHLSPRTWSFLSEILQRSTQLLVVPAM